MRGYACIVNIHDASPTVLNFNNRFYEQFELDFSSTKTIDANMFLEL